MHDEFVIDLDGGIFRKELIRLGTESKILT